MSCLIPFDRPAVLTTTGRTSIELSCIGINSDGTEMSDATWQAGWSSACISEFQNIINGYPTTSTLYTFSAGGFLLVQEDFEYMWAKFLFSGGGNVITSPGQTGFNPFQDILINGCVQIPGACAIIQPETCSNCSRAEIANLSALVGLCGCFAPSLTSTYGTSIGEISNITPECDPLCSQQTAAKNRNTTTGLAIECEATICVIDAISIGASQSTTGGASITQICPSCANSSSTNQCKCIVNVSDSGIIQSIDGLSFSDAVTFNQYCPGALCLTADPITQVVTPVECSNFTTSAGLSKITLPIPTSIWIIVVIVIVVAILVIMIFRFQGNHIVVYSSQYDPNKPLPK